MVAVDAEEFNREGAGVLLGAGVEIKTAVEKRLSALNWSVDVVLSHTCPRKYEPFDKETQKELLEQEGHVIVQPNPNRRIYRVENYKAALFDLSRLIINE